MNQPIQTANYLRKVDKKDFDTTIKVEATKYKSIFEIIISCIVSSCVLFLGLFYNNKDKKSKFLNKSPCCTINELFKYTESMKTQPYYQKLPIN